MQPLRSEGLDTIVKSSWLFLFTICAGWQATLYRGWYYVTLALNLVYLTNETCRPVVCPSLPTNIVRVFTVLIVRRTGEKSAAVLARRPKHAKTKGMFVSMSTPRCGMGHCLLRPPFYRVLFVLGKLTTFMLEVVNHGLKWLHTSHLDFFVPYNQDSLQN